MHRTVLILLAVLVSLSLLPGVSAHERYATDDGRVSIVLGEQDEPVYTYDWTNLDLILRDNATGAPVEGAEETLNVTFIAPNGEELTRPLVGQHGSPGRYEFASGYYLTLPGQYKARLEGSINGSAISGEYLLPGPRGDMKGHGFPREVPHDLIGLNAEIEALRADVESLQAQVDGGNGGHNEAPLPVFPLTLAALAALALVRRRGT